MIYPKKLLAVLPLRRQKARCFGLLPIVAAEAQAGAPLQTAWYRSGPRCKRCTARLRRSARAGSGSRLSVSAPSAGRCGGLWWRGLLRREGCRPPSRKILPGAAAAGPSGQIPAVILGAVHKVAGDPPGAVGLGVPGLGAEGDGPPGEVAGKIRHCHRAVHGSVAVGGGVVEAGHNRRGPRRRGRSPQTHPDPDGVPLAPDAALDAHGHRTAVVYLLPQILQVHPRLPAGKPQQPAAAGGESAVAGRCRWSCPP